jgi:hypothetical protein
VSIVSSTLSVVCESHTTFSGSRTVTDPASPAVSTSWMCDGASPDVPSTSSWQVVDDLLADVDGRALLLEGLLDGLDGAVDARAVAAGLGQQEAFAGRIVAAGHDLRSGHTSQGTGGLQRPGHHEPDPGCHADGERG